MSNNLHVLYIGSASRNTTSFHRADAIRRLGHQVEILDPNCVLPRHRLLRHLHYRTGYRFASSQVLEYIQSRIGRRSYDLVWVNSAYSVSRRALQWLHRIAPKLVCYTNDDPTGWRDRSNWGTFRSAVPEYDLCVVVRDINVAEFAALGAREVLRVRMSYDEVAHAPLPFSQPDQDRWSSDVVFVGTWMPERGPFLARIIQSGVPLSIYGDRWDRCGQWWNVIKSSWRGPALLGADYVKAIQYSKVALGLLSKGNRDTHTQRTTEIPYIGSVFCAERTPEHIDMFRENSEALFWETSEECAEKCFELLHNPSHLRSIALAGRERVISSKWGNENVCCAVIQRAFRRQIELVHSGRDL